VHSEFFGSLSVSSEPLYKRPMQIEKLHPALMTDTFDEELAAFDDEQKAAFDVTMGSDLRGSEATDDPADCPFELALGEPIALSAARVWKASGQDAPPEFRGLPDNRALTLLVHRITPFPRPGYAAARVWGLGLKVDVLDDSTNTIDFAPKSEFEEQADAEANVRLSLRASGDFAVEPEGFEVVRAATGIGVQDLGLSGAANIGFRLGVKVSVSSLRVQAGPVGRGVRWDLIRDDSRLTASVELLQTLAVPKGLERLPLRLTAWVRRRRFFGRPDARIWATEPIEKLIRVEA